MPVRAGAKVSTPGRGNLVAAWRRGVAKALNDWGDAVLNESQKRVPVGATVGLKDSGHAEPKEPTYWKMVEYSAPHALFVHEGTKAHWPPPGVLRRWVELVLGPTLKAEIREKKRRKQKAPTFEQAVRQAEFAVAKHIAQYGTKPQPFLRESAEFVEPKLEGFFKKHLGKEFDALAVQVVGVAPKR